MNEPSEQHVVVHAGVAMATGVALSARATTRSYFSSHHLWAAKHFAALATTEESKPERKPIFGIRHRAYVVGAITESVAFLEAAINEVFQDATDNHDGYIHSIPTAKRNVLANFWTATDEGKKYIGVQEKYNLALLLAGATPFDKGRNPHQDVATLIQLRNWLVHYRPEDFSADTEHRLGKQLTGKFPNNALMDGHDGSYFPLHALGSGCANWAHTSAVAFVDYFASQLNLTLNYQVANFGENPNEV